jgi:hypothetical protein
VATEALAWSVRVSGAGSAAKGISRQRQFPRGALGQTNAFDDGSCAAIEGHPSESFHRSVNLVPGAPPCELVSDRLEFQPASARCDLDLLDREELGGVVLVATPYVIEGAG